MRNPIAAGCFYPSDKISLIKQIEHCFLSEFGPGSLPNKNEKVSKKRIVSAIVPHAGYVFSGMCAAHVYKQLSKYKADTIILLGTDHTGNGSGISIQNWKTLFGVVNVDKDFCEYLKENSDLVINENSHSDEHSIEVQLPFLQYIYEQIHNHRFKIVPITISFDSDHKKISKSIFDGIINENKNNKNANNENDNKTYAIIASGDFTHYGHNYGYVPFDTNIKQNLKKLDLGAIKLIQKSDSNAFIDYLNKTKATVCGRFGFSVLIELNKLLKLKPELLKYYTSGDVVDDYNNSVSYASLICENK